MARTAPCEWPLAQGICDDWDTFSADVQQAATSWATEILWMLTGRIYGLCEITVRPCLPTSLPQSTPYRGYSNGVMQQGQYVGPWTPSLLDGAWVNMYCGADCSVCEFDLPFIPAASITSIQIDGETLEALTPDDPLTPESESVARYRIDSGGQLVRTNGECWPQGQDLSVPLGEEGSWGVTYKFGIEVPYGGQVAAAELACEFAKSRTGKSGCKLPSRVQSVTRQGITMTLLDTLSDLWTAGRTGLYSVDLWLQAVNPHGLRERPQIMSPELLRQRRRQGRVTTWEPSSE